jgi:hypothetical protein
MTPLWPQTDHKSIKNVVLWPQTAYIFDMKTEILKTRVTAAEKETFQQAADLAGVTLASWVRERLRATARRELVEAGRQVPFLQERIEQNG